ncbi:MAG TPA: hypothetical protein VM095_01380 [Pyrinomonadaceae bacterium]|nr:hypothetical protein [Pyrinomonadaceae bacterium]
MYQPHPISVNPLAAERRLELPINALLMLPDYITRVLGLPFNLPGAVNKLMGGSGWETAIKVMRPRVWAPGWNDQQLRSFVTAPFGDNARAFPESAVADLRETAFPGLKHASDIPGSPNNHYEIVHISGEFSHDTSSKEPYLFLNDESGVELPYFNNNNNLFAGLLRDALSAARTRLLVLQTNNQWGVAAAAGMARFVVGAGGPCVLTVSGGNKASLDDFFLNFYAGIVHNQPLNYAAEQSAPDISVQFFYGEGGTELLRLEPLWNEMRTRAQVVLKMSKNTIQEKRKARATIEDASAYLHRSQIEQLKLKLDATERTLGVKISDIRDKASGYLKELDYSRESGGAIPIATMGEELPGLEMEASGVANRYPQVSEELRNDVGKESKRAPRTLNAGFADPVAGRVLDPPDRLIAGKEYDLLVDVGPRWSKITNLVTGNGEFPELALKPEGGGYLIQVVFVSEEFLCRDSPDEEFSTGLCSAQIFVPQDSGRSFPYVNGERDTEAKPIALRLRAPSVEDPDALFMQAHGRLCLYYHNNLVQSAVVKAVVARSVEVTVDEKLLNEITVDFKLTGTFQEVEQFERRELVLDVERESAWAAENFEPKYDMGEAMKRKEGEAASHAVALNLTLNDDGSGKSRLIVKDRPDAPPAWKPFNAADAATILTEAREQLENCFYKKPKESCVVPVDAQKQKIKEDALNADFGKSYEEFRCDLFQLAQIGEKLYNRFFAQIKTEKGLDKYDWDDKFKEALLKKGVIQVARTGEAQYVFPWALVYDIPLPDMTKVAYCPIVKEWSGGVRDKAPTEQCPYEASHKSNIICPYGFWGLKHYIEQPVPPLEKLGDDDYELPTNVPTTINAGPTLEVSVGVTRDDALSQASKTSIKNHLNALPEIIGVKAFVPEGGADDWTKVLGMLESPDVVYFLCHGEYDGQDPYLGVGLRDKNIAHRVYPSKLISWSRDEGKPLIRKNWRRNRPLVFINGCHTFALRPNEVLNFVTTFADFGASGLIGTEIAVQLPLAIEVAKMLFGALAKGGMTVGEAMYQVRWKLANKGNLLGLAYTPYCMSNLRIAIGN